MEPGIAILLCVVALVLGAGVSGFICFKQGISYRKKTAEAAVGSAEKEAMEILLPFLISTDKSSLSVLVILLIIFIAFFSPIFKKTTLIFIIPHNLLFFNIIG